MMKILVCVKQVPDLERIMVRDAANGMATLDISNDSCLNRFDEFAVEEAVRIKEAMAPVQIDVITVGPQRAGDVLKRPMGMGADDGIHLKTPSDIDPGTAAVARWIAEYARFEKYDLLLCGAMSEDGMHGQVGPMVAAHLGIPYATQVIEAEPARDLLSVSVEREIEGGVREMLEIRMPAVLALQPGINLPRYPSLSRLLRAGRQPLKTLPAETLGPGEPLIDCLGLAVPKRMRAAYVVTGSAREKADRLVSILKEKAFL